MESNNVNKIPEVKQEDGISLLPEEVNDEYHLSSFQESMPPRCAGETGPENSSPGMKSPPIQTMSEEHPPGYDPNRIPASIFSSKPVNPAEWSITSNESLFSIQMGNNSFSRDYAILFGKSGEFPKIDEQLEKHGEALPRLEERSNDLRAKSSEFPSLPPVMEVPSNEESSVRKEEVSRSELKNDENESMKETVENPGKETPTCKLGTASSSPSRISDVGNNSCSSFVFPVLVNEGTKPGSLKVVPENPEQAQQGEQEQEQAPKETPDAPAKVEDTGWCSCFACWPNCC